MKIMCISVLCACMATGFASAVRADDASAPPLPPNALGVRPADAKKESAAEESDADWKHRVDLVLTMPVFGYEPATTLSKGQKQPYDASTAWDRVFRFSGVIAVEGDRAALDLRPYTDARSTDGNLKVAVGGLEARLSTPFSAPFVAGLYHHSSHNFSDGRYGFGTNLNSVYGNARLVHGSFGLFGRSAAYAVRAEAHVFFTRNATPYVLTDAARVLPGESGETAWRFSLDFDGRHPYGRTHPSLVLNGDGTWSMASGTIDLPVTFRLGDWFFGSLGEHLYLGPYGTFGWNVYETERYGTVAGSAGLRMEIVISDTTW